MKRLYFSFLIMLGWVVTGPCLSAQKVDSLIIVFERADSLYNAGNLEQALTDYDKVEVHYAGDNRIMRTLAILSGGLCYYGLGERDTAEYVLNEGVERYSALVQEIPEIRDGLLMSPYYRTLGVINQENKKYLEANGFFRKALEENIRKYGDSHPEVAGSYYDLALFQFVMGKSISANAYLHEALKIYQVSGEEYMGNINQIQALLQKTESVQ